MARLGAALHGSTQAVGKSAIRPFQVKVPEVELTELRRRIKATKWPEKETVTDATQGVQLSTILNVVGILPNAKYVFFTCVDGWWDSLDMADAFHPQTLLAYAMNGRDLPVPHGAPVRLRVERQLGYKNLKYISSITVTDSAKDWGKGQGAEGAENGYSWYAGI